MTAPEARGRATDDSPSLSVRPSLIERAASKLAVPDGNGPRSIAPIFRGATGEAPAKVAAEASAPSARRPSVTIDLARLNEKGIASPANRRSVTAEEFRRIKRAILAEGHVGTDRSSADNLWMVTSALPDEGKTFVSIGLAMSVALERDYRVLAVDGDLVRPRLDKEMGFKASVGLLDLLLDPSLDVADVVLPTNVDGLDVLPAGQPHELSTELIASKRMQGVLDDLCRRYSDGIVIFDSPPVLVTNEAVALARYMTHVLLVVAAQETSRSSVESAVEQLSAVRSLKFVLNQVRRTFLEPAYYDDYYW